MKKQILLKILIVFFAFLGVMAVATIHWQHQYVFNRPQNFDELKNYLKIKKSNWTMIHVIAAKCSCSEYLSQYLIKRKSHETDQLKEFILLIDGNKKMSNSLSDAGYSVFEITAEQVKKNNLDISALPLFVIYDLNQTVRYAGGYSDIKINPFSEFQDLAIFENIRQGKNQLEFPIRGCAVAKEYQTILDPLGLKYSKLNNEKEGTL